MSLYKYAKTLAELQDQRKKGHGKVIGSAATLAVLPAITGAQIAGYDVGRKNLLTRRGLKSMVHHGKSTAKMIGKYGIPLTAAGALINEARYRIGKHKLEKTQ